MKIHYFLISIFLYCMTPGIQAALSPVERRIIDLIDDQQDEAIALLKTVVNINSGTMNTEGVKKVGKIFSQAFDNLGFETRWVDGKPFQRAGHLVATYGSRGPRLLLIGHLDTVFEQGSPLQRYEPISSELVKGPGITDMKGGDVIMLYALKALKDTGKLDNLSITVILTGDEEKRGRPLDVATKALIEAGKWADIAIGFEDGDGNPETAVVSRRGSTSWRLVTHGRPAHSSQIFREGYGAGAIFEAARILEQFRLTLSTEPNLTFNPGVIVGGTEATLDGELARGSAFGKNNVIAESTRVNGDIRALTPAQLDQAQKKMQQIVTENLKETSAKLAFLPGYPPMAPSAGNQRLLKVYHQASMDLGYGEVRAVDPRKAGAADISFVAKYVDMAIDGLGLMGSGGHTEKEIADMNTLGQQTKRAALLFHRLGLLDR